VGTDCGNMAWTAIALLDTWEKAGRDSKYLASALKICDWINRQYDANGVPGYCGGVCVTNGNVGPIKWKSCEHNIDIFVAFKRVAKATGDKIWDERAERARVFVSHMVDMSDHHLWTGTGPEGAGTNMRMPEFLAPPSNGLKAIVRSQSRPLMETHEDTISSRRIIKWMNICPPIRRM
jgi:hypothetical protein